MEERKLIWKIIGNGKSFFDKCKRDKINAYSAQSAFFIILSTIPFLMVFSSLLQYTPITEGTLLKMYQTALPDYISAFLISAAIFTLLCMKYTTPRVMLTLQRIRR